MVHSAPSHPQPAGLPWAGRDPGRYPPAPGKVGRGAPGKAAFAINKEEKREKEPGWKIKQGKLFKSSWEVRAELNPARGGWGGRVGGRAG